MKQSENEISCAICEAKTHDLYDYYRSDGIVSRKNNTSGYYFNQKTETVTTYANIVKMEGAVCSACRKKGKKKHVKSLLILSAIEAVAVVPLILFADTGFDTQTF